MASRVMIFFLAFLVMAFFFFFFLTALSIAFLAFLVAFTAILAFAFSIFLRPGCPHLALGCLCLYLFQISIVTPLRWFSSLVACPATCSETISAVCAASAACAARFAWRISAGVNFFFFLALCTFF